MIKSCGVVVRSACIRLASELFRLRQRLTTGMSRLESLSGLCSFIYIALSAAILRATVGTAD